MKSEYNITVEFVGVTNQALDPIFFALWMIRKMGMGLELFTNVFRFFILSIILYVLFYLYT